MCLVIASDGLWEFMDDQCVMDMIGDAPSAQVRGPFSCASARGDGDLKIPFSVDASDLTAPDAYPHLLQVAVENLVAEANKRWMKEEQVRMIPFVTPACSHKAVPPMKQVIDDTTVAVITLFGWKE